MDSSKKIAIISTLWIVVMLNMAFADIFSFMLPGSLAEMIAGTASPFPITHEIMLGFAIILEIPLIMIILSRVLKARANRWVNTVAGAITVAFVVGGGSLDLTYIFFSAIEIVSIALIIWLVWKRPRLEG